METVTRTVNKNFLYTGLLERHKNLNIFGDIKKSVTKLKPIFMLG